MKKRSNSHISKPEKDLVKRKKTKSVKEIREFLVLLGSHCHARDMPIGKTRFALSCQDLLKRGNFIEKKVQLENATAQDCVKELGCTAKIPTSSNFLVYPRKMFRLVVEEGLTRLRFFQPSQQCTFPQLFSYYKLIMEYLKSSKATEQELLFWKGEKVQMETIVLHPGTEDEKKVNWVSEKWLFAKEN